MEKGVKDFERRKAEGPLVGRHILPAKILIKAAAAHWAE